MPVEPATQAILDEMAPAGPVDFSALSPATFRRLFRASLGALDAASAPPGEPAAAAATTAAGVAVEDRSIPGPAGPLPIRIYRTADAAPGPVPVIAYFHGGGWVVGGVDTHDRPCRVLCRATGAVVVSVDYRLAPEHRFPAAVDDCEAATAWIAAHAPDLGGDPGRLGVAGDSAGGNLAAAVTLRARSAGPAIKAQALVYPATDFTTVRPSAVANADGYLLTAAAVAWFAAQYLGDADGADPRASPLLADLAGLPPAVVTTAEFDPLRDEGRAYAEALAAAGVAVRLFDYPGLIHGFMGLVARSPASARATAEVWAAFAALLAP